MPVKNFVSGEVPYLESYTQFPISENVQVVDFIKDMVSYDIKPLTDPTYIDYYIGAVNSYSDILQVKNLTQNAVIELTIKFNDEIFIIHEVDSYVEGVNVLAFNLNPEQTRQFAIKLKNSSLDTKVIYSAESTPIELSFKNIQNGTLVFKRVDVSFLSDKFFPQNVTVK